MSDILHTISYVSKTNFTGDPAIVLQDLVGHARVYNAKLGLTGALICSPRYFAQVLEGPPAPLDEIIERILRDGRHRDITVLFSHPLPTRSFDGWGMASAGVTQDDTDIRRALDMVSAEASIGTADAAGARAMALLIKLLQSRELA